MTPANNGWLELRSAWQSATPDHGVRVARDMVNRAMRRSLATRTGAAFVAIASIAGAILHAANAWEAALGVGVGVAIVAIWWASAAAERRTRAALSEPGEDYLGARARILRTQIRAFRFVWVVVLILLVFLVPWWLGGFTAHRDAGLFDTLMLVAFWIPAVTMLAIVAWTWRRVEAARRELAATGESRDRW